MLGVLRPAIVSPMGPNPSPGPPAADYLHYAWLPSTNPGIRVRPDSADRTKKPLERPMSATARRAIEKSEQKRLRARPASSVGFRFRDDDDEGNWIHSEDTKLSVLVKRHKRPATALGIRQNDSGESFAPALGRQRPPSAASVRNQHSSASTDFLEGTAFSLSLYRTPTNMSTTAPRPSTCSQRFRGTEYSELPVPVMLLLACHNKNKKPPLTRPESASSVLLARTFEGKGQKGKWRKGQRNEPVEGDELTSNKEKEEMHTESENREEILWFPSRRISKAPHNSKARAAEKDWRQTSQADVYVRAPTEAHKTVFQRRVDARLKAYREDPDKQEILKIKVERRQAEFRKEVASKPYVRANVRSASRWRESRWEEQEDSIRRREELHYAAQKRREELEREREAKLKQSDVDTTTIARTTSTGPPQAMLLRASSRGTLIERDPLSSKFPPKPTRTRSAPKQGPRNDSQRHPESPTEPPIVMGLTEDFAEMNAKILQIFNAQQGEGEDALDRKSVV